MNKSLDIKPQYSDNLNTFFDHEKNIENLPGPDPNNLSEDDNLLSNEGSGPGGHSAGNTTISS